MACSIVIMGAGGRMGTTIAQLAQERQIPIAGFIDRPEALQTLSSGSIPCESEPAALLAQIKKTVLIDFTAPHVTMATLPIAEQYQTPMVIGTTGFTEVEKNKLAESAQKLPLFLSPNMSIGVSALLATLPRLVKALGNDYDLEMVEMHHNKKKDAPSGTALRLAECLAEAKEWNLADVGCYARDGLIGERPKNEIGIQTLRGGDVVGVHTVYFVGEGERIEVTHHAHSRSTFASGALRASQWLAQQKPGKLYSMQDVFGDI